MGSTNRSTRVEEDDLVVIQCGQSWQDPNGIRQMFVDLTANDQAKEAEGEKTEPAKLWNVSFADDFMCTILSLRVGHCLSQRKNFE
jgi:hypothetical protein